MADTVTFNDIMFNWAYIEIYILGHWKYLSYGLYVDLDKQNY